MARIGVNKTRMALLIRAPNNVGRCMSKQLAKEDQVLHHHKADKHKDSSSSSSSSSSSMINLSVKRADPLSWVPHPRTGIYFPAGNERVMDGVPNGAASLSQSYWLRSIDGVDKTEADRASLTI